MGEISDRLSILALKILHGTEAGKDCEHWQTERNALLVKIGARTLNGNWLESYTELATVNSAIWQGEESLREIRSHDPNTGLMESAGRVGCRLQELNDRRHELIEAINKDGGDFIGPEKL